MATATARSALRSSSLRSAAARVISPGTRPAARPAAARLRPMAPPRSLLRSPVAMSSFCLESLLPMHSATASALMTSMLSISHRAGGRLAEGVKAATSRRWSWEESASLPTGNEASPSPDLNYFGWDLMQAKMKLDDDQAGKAGSDDV